MAEVGRHIKDIWLYVEAVQSEERPACQWERLAAQRFVDDIERQGQEGFPWVFNEEKAARVIRFIEKFSHVKGKWAKLKGLESRIKLEPWQKFFIGNLFGWVSQETNLRRFNEAFLEVPRKNAKSIKGALIGNYMLAADGEAGAEVYSGATSEKQAWEVFKPARMMATRKADFRAFYKIQVHARFLEKQDGSVFKPLIGKPGDGASPSCAIIDEYHEHPNTVLYDTMETGMAAREQPLLLVITTAGDNLEGPCHQHERYCKKVLSGQVENDRLFAIIYTIDDGVPWDSETALVMANPNYGVSVEKDYLRHKQQQAKQDAGKAGAFKTKHLNLWVGAKDAWMNMEWWHRQAGDIKREDFRGCRNVSALDLASKYDVVARNDLFERIEEGGKKHYYLFGAYYIPEDTANDPDNPNHQLYQQWIEQGYLIATDGDIVDQKTIEDDAADHAKEFDTEEVGYDDWGATYLAQRLQDKRGITIVEIPQTVKQLSEPMKWLHAYVKSGQLHHDGNPVLGWMMSNVVAKEDAKENIYPNKENRHSKIDGAVGSIMALSLVLEPETDDRKVLTGDEVIIL